MKLTQKIIALTFLTTMMTYASVNTQRTSQPYTHLSTQELQVKVEKLSKLGELPFAMGLELMKRWKNV